MSEKEFAALRKRVRGSDGRVLPSCNELLLRLHGACAGMPVENEAAVSFAWYKWVKRQPLERWKSLDDFDEPATPICECGREFDHPDQLDCHGPFMESVPCPWCGAETDLDEIEIGLPKVCQLCGWYFEPAINSGGRIELRPGARISHDAIII
jgi:hypothetical protein